MKSKFNINITGLDKVQKRIEELGSEEGQEKLYTDRICALVPEATAERNNIKFTWPTDTTIVLEQSSVSPELYAKIVTALQQEKSDQ
jgi:hypothetical protein